MDKNAASKSYKDPALNKILQDKAAWNQQVSAFINDIIHLKKSMNGWPSKFYKERTRIMKPAPIDFSSILSAMTGDFQDLANQGSNIVKEQANFVKTRNQRKGNSVLDKLEKTHGPEDAPKPTGTPSGAPDLTQQLNKGLAANNSYQLISEGSNFLTRFFSRILSPGIGFTEAARIRKLRVTLLNAAAKMTKDLKAFQREIVPVFSGPASIKSASLMLSNVERNLIFLMSGLKSYKDALPQGAADTGGRIPPPKEDKADKSKPKEEDVKPNPPTAPAPSDPRIEQAAEAVKDISTHRNSFTGVAGMRDLFDLARKWNALSDEEKLSQADVLLINHRNMVNQICFDRQLPHQTTLGGIVALGTKNAASAEAELQIVAQNILGKWRHQLSLFDKTSSFRLDVHRMAGNARKTNNDIMDQLESGLHVEEILVLIAKLDDDIKRIREAMTSLGATTKGMGFQPQFMNMLQSGRLGDHAINVSPQQKTRLERLLERKQNTELMKMYGG